MLTGGQNLLADIFPHVLVPARYLHHNFIALEGSARLRADNMLCLNLERWERLEQTITRQAGGALYF